MKHKTYTETPQILYKYKMNMERGSPIGDNERTRDYNNTTNNNTFKFRKTFEKCQEQKANQLKINKVRRRKKKM